MPFSAGVREARERLENWWECGEQERPCLVLAPLAQDHEPMPDTDDLERWWTDLDLQMSRTLWLIENTRFYAEAVPHDYIDFGASAMPAVLGCDMTFVDKETIWAHPVHQTIEEVLESDFDRAYRSGRFYRLALELTRRSTRLAAGHHYASQFALGGTLDNLAALYGNANLLVDLIEKPQKVKAALERLKRVWIEAFEETQRIIDTAGNGGGIGWAGVWAPGSTFPMQEDISYMVSPEMFREFCLPHIVDCATVMDCGFYHLDGVGAIPHLDALLEIPEIKVIQWVPGAGKEEMAQWYDLLRRIISAGRACQVYARADEVPGLVENVGSRGLLVTCLGVTEPEARRLLEEL